MLGNIISPRELGTIRLHPSIKLPVKKALFCQSKNNPSSSVSIWRLLCIFYNGVDLVFVGTAVILDFFII